MKLDEHTKSLLALPVTEVNKRPLTDRLRYHGALGSQVCNEAADEIESLNAECKQSMEEICRLRKLLERAA